MTTIIDHVADNSAASPHTWLVDFLINYPIPDNRSINSAGPQARLQLTSFMDMVCSIEQAGEHAFPQAVTQLYRSWIASQPAGAPHLYMAWFNLGAAFAQAGDQPSAINAFHTALVLRPDFHPTAISLGTVLEAAGQPDAALHTWKQALQPDTARIALFNNRARLLEQLGRLDEAEAELRRSLLTDPKQPDVIQHWVHVRQKMCQWPPLSTEIPGLPVDDLLRHAGPMTTLALTDDIAIQSRAAQDWIARKTFPTLRRLSPPEGYRHDRLRIGYLSSDFCSHAMSYLITDLFEQHDRSRFEVFGYCSSPEDGSAIRDRVIRAFDHYRSIKRLSDTDAAQLIRADEIDILIDLNGLTLGLRPQILRAKPAPVQATYLGFVGPVPIPELDYMFCDRIVVPPEHGSLYQPKPLHIAEVYQANDSKRGIGAATCRSAVGLPDDKFVFCCFSNTYKITEDVFTAWMEILRKSDNAMLWLAEGNRWAGRNLQSRAVQCGIDPARIVFTPRVGPDDYMARLRLADVFLDTFPYNNGTVASDAIRMGLPLVTLSGQSFASRMATSLLTAAGARDGIATTRQQYIDFAVSLATDRHAFNSYKRLFHADAWTRRIGNVTEFTASLEASLLAIAKHG